MLGKLPLREKTEWTLVGPMGPTLPPQLLSHSVLGVDGGAHHTSRLDVWVGDADSYELEIKCKTIHRHPREKDRSDLSLALSLFEDKLLYKFHLWGFSGGRFDHELFNLGEVLHFLNEHPESECVMYNEKGIATLYLLGAGDWKFSHRGIFSLGSIETIKVQMTGPCAYPIPKFSRMRALSSFGLSNESHGEISLNIDGPAFLYFPEGKL